MAKETTLKMNLKTTVMNLVAEMFSNDYDTLQVDTHTLSIPMVDEENNERFVNITIAIPSGHYETYNGVKTLVPYDAYEECEHFKYELELKKEKEKKKLEAKKKKIAQDKIKREKLAEIKEKSK